MVAAVTQARYRQTIHRNALADWHALPDTVRADFEAILDECSQLRTPSEHEKASLMREGRGVFRLRKGDYRLLADKHMGQVRVLHVGPRETVYDGFGVALARSNDQ